MTRDEVVDYTVEAMILDFMRAALKDPSVDKMTEELRVRLAEVLGTNIDMEAMWREAARSVVDILIAGGLLLVSEDA